MVRGGPMNTPPTPSRHSTPGSDPARALSGGSRRDFLRISGLLGLAVGGWSVSGCSSLFGEEDPATGKSGDGKGTTKQLRISFVPVEVLDPQVITNGMWLL